MLQEVRQLVQGHKQEVEGLKDRDLFLFLSFFKLSHRTGI